MATSGIILECKFADTNGDNITLNIKNADDQATAQQVNTFMDACVTNNTIFERMPTAKVSAAFVETTVTPVTMS